MTGRGLFFAIEKGDAATRWGAAGHEEGVA
jgi:hypothetical protein